jgi:hypothetical protein
MTLQVSVLRLPMISRTLHDERAIAIAQSLIRLTAVGGTTSGIPGELRLAGAGIWGMRGGRCPTARQRKKFSDALAAVGMATSACRARPSCAFLSCLLTDARAPASAR